MYCTNCGNKMEDGVLFCPSCGAAVKKPKEDETGKNGADFIPQEKQKKGMNVQTDFEALRQMTEQGRRSEKVCRTIGKIFAVFYGILLVRGLINSVQFVLDGEAGVGYILSGTAALVLGACGLMYIFTEICLPVVHVKKAFYADEYLKLIRVEDRQELLNALDRMNCGVVKRAFLDENGNVCVQGKKCRHIFSVADGTVTLQSDKDNYKASLERETIAGTLLKFLAPDAPVNVYELERNNIEWGRRNIILAVVAAFCGVIVIVGAVNPDFMGGQQKYIRMIKEACPEVCPEVSYGEAFDAFFSDCSWTYFKSTDDQDVVEFRGTCYYDGEKTEVIMQFLLSMEDGTGRLYAMEMGGEPQNELMQMILMSKVYEGYITEDEPGVQQQDESGKNDAADLEEEMPPQEEELEVENQEPEAASNLMYPLLYQGYTDGAPCPVMVNDETETDLAYGTYEEMLESCVDDGVTMYAAPSMYNGSIYLPTKWDAPEEEWYQGLLSYEQYLKLVSWMSSVQAQTGLNSFYTSIGWEEAGALSGLWSDGSSDVSISIYSDFSIASACDEIGVFQIEDAGISGSIQALGEGDGSMFFLCSMSDGESMELRYTVDGVIEVRSASGGFGIEPGTQLYCIERYES